MGGGHGGVTSRLRWLLPRRTPLGRIDLRAGCGPWPTSRRSDVEELLTRPLSASRDKWGRWLSLASSAIRGCSSLPSTPMRQGSRLPSKYVASSQQPHPSLDLWGRRRWCRATPPHHRLLKTGRARRTHAPYRLFVLRHSDRARCPIPPGLGMLRQPLWDTTCCG